MSLSWVSSTAACGWARLNHAITLRMGAVTLDVRFALARS